MAVRHRALERPCLHLNSPPRFDTRDVVIVGKIRELTVTLINVRNLGVTLNAPLFSELNLVVNAGDRIGLVAANGRGKSTLLRCIAGTMEPNEGDITRSRGLTIGHVEQDVPP